MGNTIKLPLRNLDASVIHDLQEKYPEAEVSVELHPDRQQGPLSENHFWELIALFDWSHEDKDDDAVVEPAVARLAAGPMRHIFEFADVLSKKLYALDGRIYAEQIGQSAWSPDRYFSVDNFLYARCCVVANGQDLYEQVLHQPDLFPKDVTFETLLYIPAMAYERKTGQEWDYIAAFPIETYSNEAAWNTDSVSQKLL